jgi:hypothetical protein
MATPSYTPLLRLTFSGLARQGLANSTLTLAGQTSLLLARIWSTLALSSPNASPTFEEIQKLVVVLPCTRCLSMYKVLVVLRRHLLWVVGMGLGWGSKSFYNIFGCRCSFRIKWALFERDFSTKKLVLKNSKR